MLTPRAASSIEWLFDKSVREHCVASADDRCIATQRSAPHISTTPEHSRLVVVNISSYLFRIVTLVEFDAQASTTQHLAAVLKRPEAELEGDALLDAYAEFANMICGFVNRKLSAEFRHVGMSTPCFIDTTCSSYLSILEPVAIQAFEFTINDLTRFKLTVCTCVDPQETLDFSINTTEQEDTSTGELELF